MAKRTNKQAIPLVLPNNYSWDASTGKCEPKPNVNLERLDILPQALDQLRQIKGPVCVVAIAGPYRLGKSYVLSKAFDQEEVFPLGHDMGAQTIGIWLWIVPKKFKDKRTEEEFTVILLDSEGIDSPSGFNDDRNFTLIVLLCSVLIYNSANVAGRSDLENLDFIVQLSKRIRLYTKSETDHQDDKEFYKTFPYFIWLLRDHLLKLPDNCADIREYFTKKILNCKEEANTDKARKAAESITGYFPDFDAFRIPPPTYDPEVLADLDGRSSEVNPDFKKQIQFFRAFIHPKLAPQNAIKKGDLVTGEGLASLTETYVEALNTPGIIPNKEIAWDNFIDKKCMELLDNAVQTYEQEMTSLVENMMPCEADELRSAHEQTKEKCLETFKKETHYYSNASVMPYLKQLKEKTDILLSEWLQTNKQKTAVRCKELIKDLEKTILDPVLDRLVGPDGSNLDFNELVEAYTQIEQRYKDEGRGDSDIRALAFVEINSRLNDEMTRNFDVLKKLKNYDALLAKEKNQKAIMEQEKERAKEEKKRLEKEKREKQKEMEIFTEKQEEERRRMQEMFTKSLENQSKQMQNMIEAHLDAQKEEREEALARHKATFDDYVKLQEKNSEMREKEIECLKKEMAEKDAQVQKNREDMLNFFKEEMEKDRKAAKENLEDFVKRSNKENKAMYEAMRKELNDMKKSKQKLQDASFWQRTKYMVTGNPDHLD